MSHKRSQGERVEWATSATAAGPRTMGCISKTAPMSRQSLGEIRRMRSEGSTLRGIAAARRYQSAAELAADLAIPRKTRPESKFRSRPCRIGDRPCN
jgi:hypothetical protein